MFNEYNRFPMGTLTVFLLALAPLFFACSESSTAGTSEEAEGIVAIKDLDVAGVTQKGPFVKGSAVTVQGMDCKTLKLTDEFFEGTVKSDKGDFEIKNVNLSSSCAVFEVTGYYLSEVTGGKSKDKLTLRALTNLKDRKNVNINLLTNLEYDRVMSLVAGKGLSFAEAKAQAEKEVLAAFGIAGSFGEFENLNLFESGDGNAALLAVSVLMQGDDGATVLAKRMEKFSNDFAEDGVWNDSKTKKEIAEWAEVATESGKLDTIRKNIESWGNADEVSDFETYVSAVIPDSIGNLHSSSSKVTEPAEVSSSSSRHSGPDPESSSSSDFDWSIPKKAYLNPKIKYDSIVDSRDGHVYKTVKIGNQVWMAENLNYADSAKTPSLKGRSWCFDDDELKCKVAGRLYTWAAAVDSVKLANDKNNPQDCGFKKDVRSCRLPDKVQGICPDGWHLPDTADWRGLFAEVGGKSVAGKMLKSQTGWIKDGNGSDSVGFSAMPVGYRSSKGDFFWDGGYAYFWIAEKTDFDWREVYLSYDLDKERIYDFGPELGNSIRCIKDDGSVVRSSSSSVASVNSSSSVEVARICNRKGSDDCEYGTLTDDRDGQTYKTVKIGKQWWMAENLNYASLQPSDSLDSTSFCYNDSLKYCAKYGRLYFWSAAMDSAATWSENGKGCGYGVVCTPTFPVRGVCPAGWHIPNRDELYELVLAVGGENDAGDALNASSTLYEQNPYGFSFLPSGRKRIPVAYMDIGEYIYDDDGEYGYIWSSTDDYWNSEELFIRDHLEYELVVALSVSKGGQAGLHGYEKKSGYPVRCVKD